MDKFEHKNGKDKTCIPFKSLVKDMNLCVIHAKHVTIQPKDLKLVHCIRVNNGVDMFLDPTWA